jgi:hypothetical protein
VISTRVEAEASTRQPPIDGGWRARAAKLNQPRNTLMGHNRNIGRNRKIAVAVLLAGALFSGLATRAVADDPDPSAFAVEISDVAAKVGAPATMRVVLKVQDGYRILKAYNNRLGRLSSLDDGVAFDQKSVLPTIEDGALVFEVGLTATKPGKHAINGVARVGYIHGTDNMAMVSVPLIANVTGAE